jgi:hypothetical protein
VEKYTLRDKRVGKEKQYESIIQQAQKWLKDNEEGIKMKYGADNIVVICMVIITLNVETEDDFYDLVSRKPGKKLRRRYDKLWLK